MACTQTAIVHFRTYRIMVHGAGHVHAQTLSVGPPKTTSLLQCSEPTSELAASAAAPHVSRVVEATHLFCSFRPKTLALRFLCVDRPRLSKPA